MELVKKCLSLVIGPKLLKYAISFVEISYFLRQDYCDETSLTSRMSSGQVFVIIGVSLGNGGLKIYWVVDNLDIPYRDPVKNAGSLRSRAIIK